MKRFLLIILSLLTLFCFGACAEGAPPEGKYTVVVTKNIEEAGTVTGAGEYDKNELITLTATTNEGYVFEGWFEGETSVSSGQTYVFVLTQNRTITARWSEEVEEGDGYGGIW